MSVYYNNNNGDYYGRLSSGHPAAARSLGTGSSAGQVSSVPPVPQPSRPTPGSSQELFGGAGAGGPARSLVPELFPKAEARSQQPQ